MKDFFNQAFFVGNRQALLERSKAKLIVLSANGMLQRSGDTNFAFRQESNFWYLTGIDEPDMVLVLTPKEEFLIMPPRHAHRDQWDGTIDRTILTKRSGLTEWLGYEEGWQKLEKLIKKYKKVYSRILPASYIDIIGLYTNPAPQKMIRELKKRGVKEVHNIRDDLTALRQVKQPPELKAMQQAIDITCDTLDEVRSKLKRYEHEYEIEADITAGFRRRGAAGHAYTPIVAGAGNAATIHYVTNNEPIVTDSLILFDVGAEVSNYSADISRTYAVGRVSARQRDLVETVMDLQDQAFSMLKPGVKLREYEAEFDKLVARELKRLGLIDSVNDRDGIRAYYPHIVSHFLGLDTHDAGDYDAELVPNMVVTVEPGIYIADENVGVRVEDDVLITETGCKVMSRALPREP